ncbi:MAG: NUDIX domain-containing protein [Planctomycetota bacterium]
MPSERSDAIELIARGVTASRGRVLLCRNIERDYHYLPGGHVEFGEAAAEALAREYLEETGLQVRVGGFRFAAEQIFDQPNRKGRLVRRHEITLMFDVSVCPDAEDQCPSLESDIAFDWVPLEQLPEHDVRPTSTKAWLLADGKLESGAAWISESAPPS